MEEKSLWQKMLDSVGSGQAQADPKMNAFKHPNVMEAQRHATEDYFRTGEKKPLEQFMKK